VRGLRCEEELGADNVANTWKVLVVNNEAWRNERCVEALGTFGLRNLPYQQAAETDTKDFLVMPAVLDVFKLMIAINETL
jgi:hypothetical protein